MTNQEIVTILNEMEKSINRSTEALKTSSPLMTRIHNSCIARVENAMLELEEQYDYNLQIQGITE